MRKPDKARHRRRRTAEQWAALLAEHGESGLSQRAFCRSRGLSVGAFYNAKSRAKAPRAARRGTTRGRVHRSVA